MSGEFMTTKATTFTATLPQKANRKEALLDL